MKNTCTKFTSEDISRFVDRELPPDDYDRLERHLPDCAACKSLAENFMSMSTVFSGHVDQRISRMDKAEIADQLGGRLNGKSSFGNFFGTRGKFVGLKVASVLLILVISLFTFQNTLFSSPGPSAIVKSVDTDFASVMIIETQKEKHTIIWFSET